VRIVLATACALVLPALGHSADPVPENVLVRRLIVALKDSDTDVRQNLASTLAKIGTPSVEPLIAALTDPLPERRAGAAYALGLIGTPAKSALPQLLDKLDDSDRDVRRQAAYAINRMISTGVKTATTGGKE
jgi:HEAT repeat protein